ncbi:VOC family protein [Geomesophilobacter sediminis]|uniref:VOC family protein n=1 Tax=Geomesophilobacter sediminis TaxID=2798584 RepID=A0A8J7J7W0_9BACT|nr:VOC family protein [Geomesophilobacter sediminis]MBJ6725501.1 VOC family protein [Geomesophilobacter sediminis]
MPKITTHAPGTFCWTDLATTDPQGAKQFYAAVFGWKFVDNEVGPGMTYTMAQLQGEDVAALYGMPEEELNGGGRPRWQSYVAVADADLVTGKAQELGGTILAPPFDVFSHGRMAIIRDPQGAVFHLWQPRDHVGATLVGEEGTRCWSELMVRDPEDAARFYAGLFGWTTQRLEGGPIPYTIFGQEGVEGVGGLMGFPPDCPEPSPAWLVYYLTWDCDAAARKVIDAQGKVLKAPADIPGIGRFAIIEDPQGAILALFTPQER